MHIRKADRNNPSVNCVSGSCMNRRISRGPNWEVASANVRMLVENTSARAVASDEASAVSNDGGIGGRSRRQPLREPAHPAVRRDRDR